jgi:hypothetical protein
MTRVAGIEWVTEAPGETPDDRDTTSRIAA